MCQLILTDFKDAKLNRLFSYFQAMLDADVNSDGYGVFNGTTIKKTKISADKISNGWVINGHINTNPVITHVRKATTSVGTVSKDISDEQSHPFETEHFVLAHNGTLDYIGKLPKEYTGKIDSEIFLLELEKNYSGDIVKDLNKTMDNFEGKFAFLIFDKVKKKYYAARGVTAPLHYCQMKDRKTGQIIGLCINTQEAYLYKMSYLAANLAEIMTGLQMENLDIAKLEDNSVYELEDNFTLKKIGECQENFRAVSTAAVRVYGGAGAYYEDAYGGWTNGDYTRSTYNSGTFSDMEKERELEMKEATELSIYFRDKFFLSLFEIDSLLMATQGLPLSSCKIENLRSLKEFFSKYERRVNSVIGNRWQKIFLKHGMEAYNKYQVQFPWFLENTKKLKEVFTQFKSEEEKK